MFGPIIPNSGIFSFFSKYSTASDQVESKVGNDTVYFDSGSRRGDEPGLSFCWQESSDGSKVVKGYSKPATYEFLTTPTLAGLITRPLSLKPVCWVKKTVLSSLSG